MSVGLIKASDLIWFFLFVGNAKDTEEALEYFAKGQVKIPIEVQPLSALPEVFKRMREGKISGRVVLDVWK